MTFYRKNTVSKQSQILHNDQVDYLSCSVTMNYHRNATMLEKC